MNRDTVGTGDEKMRLLYRNKKSETGAAPGDRDRGKEGEECFGSGEEIPAVCKKKGKSLIRVFLSNKIWRSG